MNEIDVMEKESLQVLEAAKETFIKTLEQYEKCGEFLKTIKQLQKEVSASFDPIVDQAHKSWKTAIAKRDEHLKPLKEAESIIKEKSIIFLNKQERIRQEEQRRLDELAKKEEEKRRKALEAQAKKAEEKGDFVKAEEKLQEAQEVFVPTAIIPEAEKVSGQSVKKTYYAEVTDLLALVKAVAEGRVPLKAIEPNEGFLNKQAQLLHEDLNYPGVKVTFKQSMAVRL